MGSTPAGRRIQDLASRSELVSASNKTGITSLPEFSDRSSPILTSNALSVQEMDSERTVTVLVLKHGKVQ